MQNVEIGEDGGAERSRTALNGFAIRCITALLLRHEKRQWTGQND